MSPDARSVKIVIKDRSGRTVKTISLGTRKKVSGCAPPGKPGARGTYRYHVYAKDAAGNAQRIRGNAFVTVK